MSKPIQILFVETKTENIDLSVAVLQQSGYQPDFVQVTTAAAMTAALAQQGWDVIIAGNSFALTEAVQIWQTCHQQTPFVILWSSLHKEAAAIDVPLVYFACDPTLITPVVTQALREKARWQEQQRLESLLQLQTHHLSLLKDITEIAADTADFNQTLQMLVDRLGDLLNADGCYISLWDEVEKRAIPGAAYGPMREKFRTLASKPGDVTMTEVILQLGHPLVEENIFDSPYISSKMAALFSHHSLLGIPLIIGRQKLGAIFVSFGEGHHFTPGEIAWGEQAAGQIAFAVAKVRLLTAERKQRQLAETLREVAHALNSSLDLEQVLKVILEQLVRVMACDSASVMILLGDTLHKLTRHNIHRKGSNRTRTIEVKNFPHVQEAIREKVPVVISDTAVDPRWQRLPNTDHIRSWLGVPLIVQGDVIGLLNLTKRDPHFYREQDNRVAMAFADQAAVAIENARLYEQLQAHATQLEYQVIQRTGELAKANARLEELDRLKTKFVADMSHELRTPLTNIKLYLDLLERSTEEKRPRYMQVLKEQTQHLEKLVQMIVQLSHLEAHKENLTLTAVDLNRMIEYIINLYAAQIEESGLNLTFRPDPALPTILGVYNQLSQVVENLLLNAIQYTTEGSIQIDTFTNDDKKRICMQITDTGLGIPPEEQPFLFDRFYRSAQASQLNLAGLGLGLSLVKEIVHLHGGQVTVSSEVDVGSTFRVWLPNIRA